MGIPVHRRQQPFGSGCTARLAKRRLRSRSRFQLHLGFKQERDPAAAQAISPLNLRARLRNGLPQRTLQLPECHDPGTVRNLRLIAPATQR